jgi:acetolactate decarboxylase
MTKTGMTPQRTSILAALATAFILLLCRPVAAQHVTVVGEMRNVMWRGQLAGTIDLDTLSQREHLYGLGPLEYLTGELLIFDGQAYQSRVLTDSTMLVEASYKAKAPFFGYTRVANWARQLLPDSVRTLAQLESYLDQLTARMPRPFMFRLEGRVATAAIHIVNLPKGAVVRSPEEAHRGLQHYPLTNVPVEILGFFSTEHKAIFTHHDTFMHLHLITSDRQKMGHLDALNFGPGEVWLYLGIE